MRKFILVFFAALGVLMGAIMAERAEAVTLAAPASLALVAEQTASAEAVRYVCRNVWRCGPYGCGWRQVCHWRPGPRWRGPGIHPRLRCYRDRFGRRVCERIYW